MDNNYDNALKKVDAKIENTSLSNAINNREKNIESNNANENKITINKTNADAEDGNAKDVSSEFNSTNKSMNKHDAITDVNRKNNSDKR